ncbi:MAG: peroxiredoxin-like family protein [Pseudomonadota bacterium]
MNVGVMLVSMFVFSIVVWLLLSKLMRGAGDASPKLVVGRQLPVFECQTENGETVSSSSLAGHNAVLVFVRGSWCPFCSEQVKTVTQHYRRITESGGKLIIVTRKPLEITQRVAEQFDVQFEFWLDKDLAAATELDLVDEEAIPDRFHNDYGRRTIRPTVVVVDRNNLIRYSYRSVKPSDRPDPQNFMAVFDGLS